jgi:hypothetical protein
MRVEQGKITELVVYKECQQNECRNVEFSSEEKWMKKYKNWILKIRTLLCAESCLLTVI